MRWSIYENTFCSRGWQGTTQDPESRRPGTPALPCSTGSSADRQAFGPVFNGVGNWATAHTGSALQCSRACGPSCSFDDFYHRDGKCPLAISVRVSEGASGDMAANSDREEEKTIRPASGCAAGRSASPSWQRGERFLRRREAVIPHARNPWTGALLFEGQAGGWSLIGGSARVEPVQE